jgi:hypothetical protein
VRQHSRLENPPLAGLARGRGVATELAHGLASGRPRLGAGVIRLAGQGALEESIQKIIHACRGTMGTHVSRNGKKA